MSGGKYQPLQNYLRRSDQSQMTLGFGQTEALTGESLPASTRTRKAWWSNRSSGGLQAKAWMEVDYLVESVDLVQPAGDVSPTSYKLCGGTGGRHRALEW